jgi:hypothetical protein
MFRRYEPRGAKISLSNESVRMSNNMLAFSSEVWEKCFSKSPKLALFFEEETNSVGMKGTQDGGYVVSDSDGKTHKVVRWVGFVKNARLSFETPVTKKIECWGDMWIAKM